MSIKFKPLNPEQFKVLEQFTEELEPEQLIWVNGYLHAITGSKLNTFKTLKDEESDFTIKDANTSITLLYGTHTGHSEDLAKQFKKKAEGYSVNVRLLSMDEYKPRDVAKEKNLLIIVSTHGEGEPPIMAEDFHEYITSKRAPNLPELNYSVLALGDSSYKLFCQTGIDIDSALSKSGAKSIYPIVTCDVDYEEAAKEWMNSVLEKLSVSNSSQLSKEEISANSTVIPEYSKKKPFKSTVLEKVRITGRESDKEVYHLELDLEGSGISYEPGDALGVIAQNPPKLVSEIMEVLEARGDGPVEIDNQVILFEKALSHYYEITILTKKVIQKYVDKTGDKSLTELLNDDERIEEYLYGHDILDLLTEFPHKLPAAEFLDVLRPLPPRLYSISSSQKAVGEEVHITVAKVEYENKGRKRFGACSSFLGDRVNRDDELLIYIEKNQNFRLPENGTPIIMIGAGTGIAPYRGFLQEREADERKGKTWLFFGDRTFYSDFLYQVEWQKYLQKGYLEKIDLAFSRDQEEKVYVQHKLKEQKEEVFKWLEQGANLYLCGDMKYMAKDVQSTLEEIVLEQGAFTPAGASEYVKKLKKEKRFQMDVY